MTDESATPATDPRMSRRRLLAKGAVAGGVLWAVPVIESFESTAAAASAAAPTAIYVYGSFVGFGTGYITITPTGPSSSTCAGTLPPAGTCATCQAPPGFIPGSCSLVTISTVKNVTTVAPALVGIGLNVVGSFMVCAGKCYRPTAGANGSLVFNCGAPGAKCA